MNNINNNSVNLVFISASSDAEIFDSHANRYLNSKLLVNTKKILTLDCFDKTDLSLVFSSLFTEIYDLNVAVAIKWLFFIRDSIKTNLSKNFFKFNFKWLALNHDKIVKELIVNEIPKHENWSDVFCLFELKKFTEDIIDLFDQQLAEDCKNNYENMYDKISSLALYLPNINSKSSNLAYFISNKLKLSPVTYQKVLKKLRKNIIVKQNNNLYLSKLSNIDNLSIIKEINNDYYKSIDKLINKNK